MTWLWESLTTSRPEAEVRCWDGKTLRPTTWDEFVRTAAEVTAGLRQRGIERGRRVACILTNTPEVLASTLGIWGAGATVASVPTIARGMSVPDYARRIDRICEEVGSPLLLVEERFASHLAATGRVGREIVTYESLPAGRRADWTFPAEHDVAFVQYSSGSTSDPRGCMLTTSAIGAQLRLLGETLGVDPDRDRGMMWLPLSHDMGFFGGLLLCWAFGLPGLLSTPERFLGTPRTWLDDCAGFGATITAGPSSALALATRAARGRRPAPLALRTCVVGGERIDWDTVTGAAEVLGECGLGLQAITPAYGLAEAVLAVSVADPDRIPAAVAVDSRALAEGETVEVDATTPGSTWVVSVGSPLPGVRLDIRAEDDAGAPRLDVGEIRVQTPSLAAGYLNDPAATAATFVDGWLRTGDLGFVRERELHVTGRIDDLLVVDGRNVYARDIEALAGASGLTRPGNCVVIDLPGRGRSEIVLVAERASEDEDPRRVAAGLARITARAAGLTLDRCVFVERGALPKTPSGKPQRYRCRALAMEAGRDVTVVRL